MTTSRKHRIVGHLAGLEPDTGLRIEACPLGEQGPTVVADGLVGPDGRFSLLVAEGRLRPDRASGRRGVYFRVFLDDELVADTRDHVRWLVGDDRPVSIHAHPVHHHHGATASGDKRLVVTGKVLEANGGPVAGVPVCAFDKTLRHEAQVGAATTGSGGSYTIDYTAAQLTHRAGPPPDLVVRAYRPDGTVWAESPILFRAPSPATITVVLDGPSYVGFSELETVSQAIMPALDGVLPKNLTATDIAFLVGDRALSMDAVQAFADSARLSDALGVAQGILDGLLREGQPSDTAALAVVPAETLEDAVQAALAANVMPAALAGQIGAAVATITKGAAASALGDAASPQPGALGPVISISGAPRALQEQVLTAFAGATGPTADTWQTLAASNAPKQIAAMQLAIQLGAVARNHAPLIGKLGSLVASGQVASLRDLAKLDRYAWYDMLSGAALPPDVPGSTAKEKQWNFAVTLERTVEDAEPTAVLAARLASAAAAPQATGSAQLFSQSPTAGTNDMVQFFTNSPDFVLDQTDVGKYLASHPATVTGVADVAGLTASLQKWQRVAKVTPHASEMQALVAAGYGSALSIVRDGKAGFAAKLSEALDAQRAEIVFGNASQAATTALMLRTQFDPNLNMPRPAGLEAWDPAALAQAFAQNGLPSYTTLFGSVDFCACDDCRSVGSPAAYLVDLLRFLGSGFAKLDAMRPDIKQIQLSCVNTTTPLPYIDLVSELLENAVAAPPAPAASAPAAWPNTGWTADELLASPEYVNTNAYDVLSKAAFPWTLPFDLWAETANVYLKHSLKQGLCAGESLAYDLRRMEAAYLEKNRRELEITKSVSLAALDPTALVNLKTSGVCFVVLPEALFDADNPGHYMRRIKSISVTIPCEVGPYTSVNCTLTLVRYRIRLGPDPNASALDPTAFEDKVAAIESIVTSTAQGDAGLFETNLRDERFLPFEGAGAVSLWRIELPPDTNAFDTSAITDLILHLRYTARDGGQPLRDAARGNLQLGAAPAVPASLPAVPTTESPQVPLVRLFSARDDFSDAFYRFKNPAPSAAGQSLALDLSDARFPYHAPTKAVTLSRVRLFLHMRPGSDPSNLQATLVDPSGTSNAAVIAADASLGMLPTLGFTVAGGATGAWNLEVAEAGIPAPIALTIGGHTRIAPNAIEDIGILCDYSLQ